MKKVILTVAFTAITAFASSTTINATMSLMEEGLVQVQKGFLYSSQDDIVRGVETIESANAIFTHVDVSTFIQNNSKVQVTKNINKNLSEHLKALKKDVKAKKYSDASEKYAKVVNDCVSCHTIIRGW
ncbi:MAG: cytochrome C [Campylobacterota bacterium]|nr:cytochrome C [Campylobacterota bacterium]